MIPRLIVAAILVNVSFWITALAVDLSNLLGYNLQALFGNFDINPTGNVGTAGGLWTEIMGAVLLVGGIALLVIAIALAPTALLAFGVVILILVARKALIVLLIVLAPIAFVAYLLPNTEDLFKKWYKMFFALLMVFPIVSVVFGASKLASDILLSISQSDPDDTQLLMKLTAVAVLAVPLFAVPSLLMGSLKAAGAIGARLEGLSNRTNKYAGKKAMEGRIGEAKMAMDMRRQKRKVEARMGKGRMSRIGSRMEKYGGRPGKAIGSKMQKYDVAQAGAKLDESKYGKYLGGDMGAARAVAERSKMRKEERDRQATLLSETDVGKLFEVLTNENASDERRAAAVTEIMDRGGDQHVHEALDYIGKNQGAKGMVDIQQYSAEAVAKRRPKAMGNTDLAAYKAGTYAKSFEEASADQILAGKHSAEDWAAMSTDELYRSAKVIHDLAANNQISQEQYNGIFQELQKVRTSDKLKGTLDPQRESLLDDIIQTRAPTRNIGIQNPTFQDPTTVSR